MELKKLHMGTMSYSSDTMDEIQTHLASSFEQELGKSPASIVILLLELTMAVS
jgi:phospholipid-translocating ATPase